MRLWREQPRANEFHNKVKKGESKSMLRTRSVVTLSKGYSRYYWDAVTDQAVGNYFTEAIVPTVTCEESRY